MKVAVGALVLLLATGCDPGTVAGQAVWTTEAAPLASTSPSSTSPSSTSPSSTSASSTSPSSTSAEPTTKAPVEPPEPDVGECFDGDCEITVSQQVDVPVDPALGFEMLSVELTAPETVQFGMSGPGISGGGSVSGSGDLQLNDLLIHVVAFTENGVTLSLTPVA